MCKSLLPNVYKAHKPPWLLRNYEKFLSPIREQPLTLLELGIQEGNSLLMWRDYLPNSMIVGVDRNSAHIADDSSRIQIYCGQQEDTTLLDRIGRTHAPEGFDIIIDDASHIGMFARVSFRHLFPNWLKPRGMYFIEDWGTGYWSSWPDGAAYNGSNHVYGMVGFVKELIDECGIADATLPGLGNGWKPQVSTIEELNITLSHVMIRKRTL